MQQVDHRAHHDMQGAMNKACHQFAVFGFYVSSELAGLAISLGRVHTFSKHLALQRFVLALYSRAPRRSANFKPGIQGLCPGPPMQE